MDLQTLLIAAHARRSFERQGLMSHLGATLLEAHEGRCVIEAPFGDHLSQQHGYFHGGVTAALADAAAGHAAISLLPEGKDVVTVEFKISLTHAARGGLIRAKAESVKAGRRLIVLRATVSVEQDDSELVCAEFLGTMIVLP